MRPRIANAQWRQCDPRPEEVARIEAIDRQMDALAERRKDLSETRQRITSRIRARYLARQKVKERRDDRAQLCG
jgi:hypothetical protein